MGKPSAYVLWCKWGTMPLESQEREGACHEALDYATRNGLYVVVYEAGEGGREVACCPPTLQTDAIPYLLACDMGCLGIDARLN